MLSNYSSLKSLQKCQETKELIITTGVNSQFTHTSLRTLHKLEIEISAVNTTKSFRFNNRQNDFHCEDLK